MNQAYIIWLVGCAFALAGCMSVQPPTDTKTPWAPTKAAQQPDNIWDAVRAQHSDFSKPLTLAELVDIALQNNPASRKAWHEARAAVAQVSQARGYFMPTLVATAEAGREKTAAEPDSFDSSFTKYGPGLQVNYLILNFGGGRKAAVEAALQTVYTANYNFNRSIQDVLLATETAYYGLISAQANVQAAEASVQDARTALDAAQIRKSAGAGTELEVLQAQTAVDQTLYQQANAQGLAMIARGNLNLAIGFSADTVLQVIEPNVEVAESIPSHNMQKLIDEALQHRPDIAALRASLAAKQALVKVQGSPLWPSLYFNGNVNRDYFKNISGKDLQDSDWSYIGGLSLRWTLFDGLQTLNAKRIAQAEANALQDQLKQAELAASADVWTRYQNYETALQKYKFSSAYLKSSSASYDLALEGYKAGIKSILDLLNAESQLALARSQQIAARQETFTALAHLAYSTGLLEKCGSLETQDYFSNSTLKDDQP